VFIEENITKYKVDEMDFTITVSKCWSLVEFLEGVSVKIRNAMGSSCF